jgi:hypothetical protein
MGEPTIGTLRGASGRGAQAKQYPTVAEFLQQILAGGRVPVVELEVKARAAGLIGARQHVTDAKRFRSAKKKLDIRSIRDGFGRGGEWFWELPTPTKTAFEPAIDPAQKPSPTVAYVEAHSRPEQRDHGADHGTDESVQGDLVPSEWVTGIARLDLARAPRDVPPHRWRQFVSDCHQFLTSNWAVRASEMGWDTAALFGCHPMRPLDHLPAAGLLWRIAGGRISAMRKDWVAIEINGVQHIVHMRPASTSFKLPWKLR